jgi:hypothetical protein
MNPLHQLRAAFPSMLVFVALALGCDEDQHPTPTASPPTPAPTLESKPEPEPAPAAQENCDIEVVGDQEVERAALDTNNGQLTKIEVIDGRTLKIVCPEGEERKGALIIAELRAKDGIHSVDNVVSWKVDLDPDPNTNKLRLVDSTRGVPELNEEDLALLKQEAMPGMREWTAEAAPVEAEPTAPTAPTKQAPAKVSVGFNAGRLKWAELMYEHQTTKRAKKVVLDNQATRSLEPGIYALSVRYPEDSEEWRDAGTLEIPAGLKTMQVTMKESPTLRADIVSSQ